MKQIDLEPEEYRETGRARLIRSILHKPVFMTITTVLAVWVAITWGVTKQYGGILRVPDWVYFTLYPSVFVSIAFGIFCILNDADRVEQWAARPVLDPLAKPTPERLAAKTARMTPDEKPAISRYRSRPEP